VVLGKGEARVQADGLFELRYGARGVAEAAEDEAETVVRFGGARVGFDRRLVGGAGAREIAAGFRRSTFLQEMSDRSLGEGGPAE
jgi:hypothetical protein